MRALGMAVFLSSCARVAAPGEAWAGRYDCTVEVEYWSCGASGAPERASDPELSVTVVHSDLETYIAGSACKLGLSVVDETYAEVLPTSCSFVQEGAVAHQQVIGGSASLDDRWMRAKLQLRTTTDDGVCITSTMTLACWR